MHQRGLEGARIEKTNEKLPISAPCIEHRQRGVLALANEGHQEEASSLYFISHPTLFLLNIFNTTKYTIRQFSKLRVCEYYL